MKSQSNVNVIVGYLHLVIRNFHIPQIQSEIVCHISMEPKARCQTQPSLSDRPFINAFLIEVAESSKRLMLELKSGENQIGECSFSLEQLCNYRNILQVLKREIFNKDNEKKGSIHIQARFYTAEYGKLKIRVFDICIDKAIAKKFNKLTLKIKSCSVYAQKSPEWHTRQLFDHDFELLVLSKNGMLQFELIWEELVLAQFTYYDIEKCNLLIDQVKAYQVHLFDLTRSIGVIKYQIQWIH